MTELPAFISFAFGDALAYELMLIIIFVLVLRIRKMLYRILRWYEHKEDDGAALKAALWDLLRNK